MNVLAARRAWWLVRCAGAIVLSMHAAVALAGVELIDVGIDDPPNPPVQPTLFAQIVPREDDSQAMFEQEWAVAIEQAAIQQPADAIELNLPDREPIVVSRLHWEARAGFIPSIDGYGGQVPDPHADPSAFSWRWYGKSDRGYTLALTLVEGQLAGRIWAPANVHYALEQDADTAVLGRIRPEFWEMHPPEAEAPSEAGEERTVASPKNGLGTGGKWDPMCVGAIPTGQHPIDVLVIYTPAMVNGSSPNGYSSVAAFSAAVHASIDDANQALRNVNIHSFSYALRGIEPVDPNDHDYEAVDIREALDLLSGIQPIPPPTTTWCTFPGNSIVASRRTSQWADIVALARTDASLCGYSRAQRIVGAYDCPREPGPGYDPFSYLIFNPKCTADRLNLAHELGHLLGMEHDPLNARSLGGSNKPSCPWSFGHRRSEPALQARYHFRTVMAYYDTPLNQPGPPGPPSCVTPANCPQIDAYSNPDQDWHGEDDGVNPPPYGLQTWNPTDAAPAVGELTHPTWTRSKARDTLPRLAPIVAAFRPRPDLIFADGFES